ncbi:uncharacterized protein [Arachis hypogaea]|uniref:uncharacterized protein n=1 Tax=Arachis hypogaea TaxID=3818 RepID=UPI003B21A129
MADSQKFVRRCKKCQKNASFHKVPTAKLGLLMASRPFSQWRIDLLGPFPVGPGQLKYLIVAIDYYTKWIEAEPLANISLGNCRKFVWRQIISKFRITKSDNSSILHRKNALLTYGIDAIIPVEIGEPNPRLLLGGVDEAVEKDLVNETRKTAHLSETALKQRIALCYNAKVLRKKFEPDDLVLQRNNIGLPTLGEGKQAAN